MEHIKQYNYIILSEKEKKEYDMIKKGIEWLYFWSNLGHGFDVLY
jgi:hypothetical protein